MEVFEWASIMTRHIVLCTGGHMTSMETTHPANEEIDDIHAESVYAVHGLGAAVVWPI